MPEPDDLRRISAALDGEEPMPTDLDAGGRAFLAAATRLRSRVRVEEAATPPDVTAAVLARIQGADGEEGEGDADTLPAGGGTARRRARLSLALSAAAAFLLAALVTTLLVRPGGPLGPEPALADVGRRVLAAQHDVTRLDASLRLTERGAHPRLPVREYEGTLRYRAPEHLWLRLEDRTERPGDVPANDAELVIDGGTAWSTGLQGCPVGAQPACLGSPGSRVTTGLAPFAPDWVAPLDLVVPTGAFLPGVEVAATEADGTVVVDTTVARLQRTVDGLRTAGALRAVHPTDPVRLVLDGEAFTIARLTVTAGDSAAREAWAASNGYTEAPGTAVLDLAVTERALPDVPFPEPPAPARHDAGFADRATVTGPEPGWLPDGYTASRAGVRTGNGPTVTVRSWTDGRGWIRLDTTRERHGDQLFGDLGPLVRRVTVGDGVGYTDPRGSVVSLHAGDLDLAVTGSVPLDQLVAVAASLPVTGRPVPDRWPQGQVLDALPTGALRPDGPLVARYDGADLVVAVPGPGQTSAVLRQQPGTSLGLPARADVVEVAVRGTVGRHDPRSGTVTWIEDGWVRELRSEGLDLDALVATATALEPA